MSKVANLSQPGSTQGSSSPSESGQGGGFSKMSDKDLMGVITDKSSSIEDKLGAAIELLGRMKKGQQDSAQGGGSKGGGQPCANPGDCGDSSSGESSAMEGLMAALEELIKTLQNLNASKADKQAAVEKFGQAAGAALGGGGAAASSKSPS